MFNWAFVLVAVVLSMLLIQPIAAQSEAIDLRVRMAAGEIHYHAMSVSVQLSADVGGTRSNVEAQSEGRRAVRVLEVRPDGSMLAEVAVDDLQVTTGGLTEDLIDAPATFRVVPNGRVVEKIAGAEHFDDFPIALPGRPVRVGETWTRETTVTESGISGRGTGTYTLVGLEGSGDGRVARIRAVLNATVTSLPLGPLPAQAQVRTSGTLRGTGEVVLLVDRGRTVRESAELNAEVQSDVTSQGQSTRIRLTMRSTTRHEPLARESVTVPPVTPDLLIAPGKGIGPFTLDLPAAELTSRLGEPELLPGDLGFRAPVVGWRSGLSGFIDPTDQAKVIGLEISDRSHRTEKGIRFGSSEGAVLMAYGMTPVRVNMTIPQIGGVRMLVYNDQGIAFAITSDAEHARRGPGHAPIGAVDWITVFAPGSAAKIYPLR